jgi:hypothetical protein
MKNVKSIFVALILIISAVSVKAQMAALPVDNLIGAYLDVKDALTADNSATAEAKAKILYTEISAIKITTLPSAQQTAWKNYADKLSFDSRHISESAAIDHQREHFASLSKNMFALVKALKTNTATLYLQYCPMKKESWISNKAAIENPYYGKGMPDCGSVKETLKAVK